MTFRSNDLGKGLCTFYPVIEFISPEKMPGKKNWNFIKGNLTQETINWRASSNPDFIQNYSLLRRMFNFFDNRDKCRKPGFLRDDKYTSCISMVLLDHFANKSNTFLSRSSISSHFLLGAPLPPTLATRLPQLMVP